MTQTTRDTEAAKQSECRLWIEYMSELRNAQLAWLTCEEIWRGHVLTGLTDDTVHVMWQQFRETHALLSQRAKVAYRQWQQVAYPLHDIPVSIEDEESSS